MYKICTSYGVVTKWKNKEKVKYERLSRDSYTFGRLLYADVRIGQYTFYTYITKYCT